MKLSFPAFLLALTSSLPSALAQVSPPDPTPCNIAVQLDPVGALPAGNLASPVPVGKDLFLIDQREGKIYLDDKAAGSPEVIFTLADAPAGLSFDYLDTLSEYISNVSPGPSDNELYVGFESLTLPDGATYWGTSNVGDGLPDPIVESHSVGAAGAPASPPADLFRLGDLAETCADYCCLCNGIFADTRTIYHVIYKFTVKNNKKGLVDPEFLAAFATQSGPTHKGAGMATLTPGELLFATGDALPFGTNGRAPAQDDSSATSKLFRISPDGDVSLLAKGLRQPQHLEFVDTGLAFPGDEDQQGDEDDPSLLAIMEIGGVTAEEINIVSLADLLDTTTIENFGWGIAPDGYGREGTFYNTPGIAGIFGTQPAAVTDAFPPVPEAGYIQPHAQYGRTSASQFVAVTGPVTSLASFTSIKALFGDLNSGQFFATIGDLSNIGEGSYGIDEDVCVLQLVDAAGSSYDNAVDFSGFGDRVDPRFFRFPDGTAGVLFEATGVYYRVTQA